MFLESNYEDFIRIEVNRIDKRIETWKEKEQVCGCKYAYKVDYLEKMKTTLLDSITENADSEEE